MKLRARTTMHVGSICVRATRAPLGRAVAAEDLALQAGLDLPAKLELGAAGEPGLTVELMRNGEPQGERDSAASLLNLACRLFERERAGRDQRAKLGHTGPLIHWPRCGSGLHPSMATPSPSNERFGKTINQSEYP